MRYKLLAIDLDGTLLGSDHQLAEDTAAAVQEAQSAGLPVCLATGRSYIETVDTWRELSLGRPHQPLVLIGGALVSEPLTARTLHSDTIRPEPANALTDALIERGYSAMGILDAYRNETDYVLVESAEAGTSVRQWFDQMDVKVIRSDRMCSGDDYPCPLRISAVVKPQVAESLARELRGIFADEFEIHSIHAPNYGITVVEAFAAGVSKFSALSFIARSLQIAPSQIAAVGDDINDLKMIRRAGLGVAMPDAPQFLKDHADHVATGGLAGFIRGLIAGEFD